jgi:hypothetical protein
MIAQRLPQYMTLDEYHELVRKNPDVNPIRRRAMIAGANLCIIASVPRLRSMY